MRVDDSVLAGGQGGVANGVVERCFGSRQVGGKNLHRAKRAGRGWTVQIKRLCPRVGEIDGQFRQIGVGAEREARACAADAQGEI